MLRCLIYKVHTALSGGSLFYHLVSPLSSTFFKFFKTFFSAFPRGNHPVHSPAALADDLFILPPLPHFVKHFFKSFSICFCAQLALEGSFLPPSRTAYVGYHTPSPLSSTFFLFFRVFLSVPFSPCSAHSVPLLSTPPLPRRTLSCPAPYQSIRHPI